MPAHGIYATSPVACIHSARVVNVCNGNPCHASPPRNVYTRDHIAPCPNRTRTLQHDIGRSRGKHSRYRDASCSSSPHSHPCSPSCRSSPSPGAHRTTEENHVAHKKPEAGNFLPAPRSVAVPARVVWGEQYFPHPRGARQLGPLPRNRTTGSPTQKALPKRKFDRTYVDKNPPYDAPRWVGAGPRATAPKRRIWYNHSNDNESTRENVQSAHERLLPGRKMRFHRIQSKIDNTRPQTRLKNGEKIVLHHTKLCYTSPPTGPSATNRIHCEHLFSFADEVRKCNEERCRLLRLKRHHELSEYLERLPPSAALYAARQREMVCGEAQHVVDYMRKYLKKMKPGRMDREREQATKRLEVNLQRLKMADEMEKIETRSKLRPSKKHYSYEMERESDDEGEYYYDDDDSGAGISSRGGSDSNEKYDESGSSGSYD
eukprot:GEMP01034351.1.p1 GENE.GEMP01034351.1~~GEMP01034351.1.p1  ORF type:complete len:431 (+),score=72.65 GEMP01034351.1:483-1775(+)